MLETSSSSIPFAHFPALRIRIWRNKRFFSFISSGEQTNKNGIDCEASDAAMCQTFFFFPIFFFLKHSAFDEWNQILRIVNIKEELRNSQDLYAMFYFCYSFRLGIYKSLRLLLSWWWSILYIHGYIEARLSSLLNPLSLHQSFRININNINWAGLPYTSRIVERPDDAVRLFNENVRVALTLLWCSSRFVVVLVVVCRCLFIQAIS